MSNVKIKKAKVVDDLFLEASIEETISVDTKKKQNIDSTIPVHPDLKASFKRLHRHLAILCDETKTPKKNDFEKTEYESFHAKGFSIGGKEENEGVVITGYKVGQYGSVTLNTPFVKFDDSNYTFVDKLKEDVDLCISEVHEYLFNDKRAPESQLSMEFPSEDGSGDDSEDGSELDDNNIED